MAYLGTEVCREIRQGIVMAKSAIASGHIRLLTYTTLVDAVDDIFPHRIASAHRHVIMKEVRRLHREQIARSELRDLKKKQMARHLLNGDMDGQ